MTDLYRTVVQTLTATDTAATVFTVGGDSRPTKAIRVNSVAGGTAVILVDKQGNEFTINVVAGEYIYGPWVRIKATGTEASGFLGYF